MHAQVGDRIVSSGRRSVGPKRVCRVLKVHGRDGQPPYMVEWEQTGHTTLFVPGPDSTVEHLDHAASPWATRRAWAPGPLVTNRRSS
jgi:hypothetical protein